MRSLSLKLVVFFCSVLLFPLCGFCWQAPVKYIHDGDNMIVILGGKEVDVRLYGIDSPEMDQPYGLKARRFVSRICKGKTVRVESFGHDQYGRTIGMMFIEGKSLNELLIEKGLAWVYKRYCHKPFCQKWKSLEARAREQEAGLWSDSDPSPPWEWRYKQNKQR